MVSVLGSFRSYRLHFVSISCVLDPFFLKGEGIWKSKSFKSVMKIVNLFVFYGFFHINFQIFRLEIFGNYGGSEGAIYIFLALPDTF